MSALTQVQYIIWQRSFLNFFVPTRPRYQYSFDFNVDRSRLSDMARSLRANGFTVINNYISSDVAALAEKETFDLLHSFGDITGYEESFSTEEYIVNVGSSPILEKNQRGKIDKPVVNIRKAEDHNLVDIYNVDGLRKGTYLQICIESLNNQFVRDLITHTSKIPYVSTRTHLYYNHGVIRTRDFHVDSFNRNIKCFVYLTDVLDSNDGPYSYIPRSHKNFINVSLYKLSEYLGFPIHNMDHWDPKRRIEFLGRKGTLIVSFQNGAHRGMPQHIESKRAMLVQRWKNKKQSSLVKRAWRKLSGFF